MENKIKKAVIWLAGLGRIFLPAQRYGQKMVEM